MNYSTENNRMNTKITDWLVGWQKQLIVTSEAKTNITLYQSFKKINNFFEKRCINFIT